MEEAKATPATHRAEATLGNNTRVRVHGRVHAYTRTADSERSLLEGGYLPIRTIELCIAFGLLQTGALQPTDIRTWLAIREMQERRKHIKQTGKTRNPKYSHQELHRLIGGGATALKSSLRRLAATRFIVWHETHPRVATSPDELTADDIGPIWAMYRQMPRSRKLVPMPRRILRMLVSGVKRSVLATAMAQLIWCLYYHKDSGWNPTGSCKASWIAEAFNLSTRSVSRARTHLMELGWLEPKESPGQWHANRYGASFAVNLVWNQAENTGPLPAVGEGQSQAAAEPKLSTGSTREERQQELSTARLSTPQAPNRAILSTPIKTNASSNEELKNHKPTSGRPPGVCKKSGGEVKPSIRNVQKSDLGNIPRLVELFEQATKLSIIEDGPVHRLNFVAAAEHARVRGSSNPAGLFMHLVRKRLWHFITQSDEDAVRFKLSQYLLGESMEVRRATSDEDDWSVEDVQLGSLPLGKFAELSKEPWQ